MRNEIICPWRPPKENKDDMDYYEMFGYFYQQGLRIPNDIFPGDIWGSETRKQIPRRKSPVIECIPVKFALDGIEEMLG